MGASLQPNCATTLTRSLRGGIDISRGVAILALALVMIAAPARAAELDRITLGGGVLLKPTEVNGWALGVDFRSQSPPWWLTPLGDDVYHELAVGQWLDVEANSGVEHDIEFVEGGTFWRYRPAWIADRWYIDFGVGLAYFSDEEIDRGRSLDSRLLFNADLSLGRPITENGRWHLGGRWRHNSNGGILGDPKRNPGADVVLLELSRRL